MTRRLRLLGISGSLRRDSTNTMLLRAAAIAAPNGVAFDIFGELGELPIFNPDIDHDPWSPAVLNLRSQVAAADGLVIACPEYAHGIPGGLKNALDWLVSGSEAPGKPVIMLHASDRSNHGRGALSEVLLTMSMALRPDITAIVPLLGLDLGQCAERLAASDVHARLSATLRVYAESLSA